VRVQFMCCVYKTRGMSSGKGVRVQWTAGGKEGRLSCRTVPSELRCGNGIWHSDGGVAEDSACIVGRGVPAVSKDRDTFTFMVKQSE
jgi:hypothetical protein